MNATNDLDLGDDLQITETTRRASGSGTWVCGTIHGPRFDALVFPEHAENPDYEIDDSRISKLWLQRLGARVGESVHLGRAAESDVDRGGRCSRRWTGRPIPIV